MATLQEPPVAGPAPHQSPAGPFGDLGRWAPGGVLGLGLIVLAAVAALVACCDLARGEDRPDGT